MGVLPYQKGSSRKKSIYGQMILVCSAVIICAAMTALLEDACPKERGDKMMMRIDKRQRRRC